MSLKIYNTLTRKTEDFVPLKPGHVNMYVCGPTVYDFLHIGNFRGVVFFNMLRRWLEHSGYKVKYALNFTDVDDKIIQRAQERGEDPRALAERFINEYKKDFESLGLRPHDENPKVTESMTDIIQMVETLIEKNKAYQVQGDVNFAIDSFSDYGKLSGRQTEDQQAGNRIDVDERKKNPFDFALWKSAKPGEVSWPSPWGPGRPGWHIECSAMIKKIFGDQIDIHGGGMDLLFPHHENEIAQSEGCSGHQFVKYWVHWNMLNFGSQKMSKSLGNIISMREFLEMYNAEIYKWMILSVHYRTVSDFSDAAVDRAVSGLARVYSSMAAAQTYLSGEITESDVGFDKITLDAWTKIEAAMNNDFGTPEVFANIFEVVRQFNNQVRRGLKPNASLQAKAFSFMGFMKKISGLLSLFQEEPAAFLLKLDDMLLKKLNVMRSEVDALIAERSKAREAKDFAKSDEYRDKLMNMGISVSDSATGTHWEVTK